jgi:hypothetical protein
MLALVASISLMVALILGMGATTRSSQRSTVCAHRVRNILTAMSLYSADNSDYLPHSGWGSTPLSGVFGCWAYDPQNMGRDSKLPARIPDADGKGDGSVAARQQLGFQKLGQLWPYLKNHSAYRCPSDDPQTRIELNRYQGRSLKIISYAMNPHTGTESFGISQGLTYKINGFKGEDIAFQEISDDDRFNFNDGSNSVGEGVCLRHFGGGYLGRFDGGTELITFEAYYGLIRQKYPNRLYCGPSTSR